MNPGQLQALADFAKAGRPEWDLWAITQQIKQLSGSDADITAHVLRIAADRNNRSPVMLTTVPMQLPGSRNGGEQQTDRPERPGDKRPCDICSRTEWACQRAQQNTGLDFHPYRPIPRERDREGGAPAEVGGPAAQPTPAGGNPASPAQASDPASVGQVLAQITGQDRRSDAELVAEAVAYASPQRV